MMTLSMTGVLLVSVTAMLYSVRHTTRSTDDKYAHEECFHAATAGVQMTNAWMLRPKMATRHLGENVGKVIEAITSGTVDMSTDVILSQYESAKMTPAQMLAYFNGTHNNFTAEGTLLQDGRRVIYTFPDTNGKIIVFQNDSLGDQTASLFDPMADRVRSYISKLRITTPYPANSSGQTAAGPWVGDRLGLRRVSLIVESEAVTIGAGVPKNRIVQQKTLVYPPVEGAPPLSLGHAIISGAGIAVKGTSSLNVHWGPALVKGDIDLLDLGPLAFNGSSSPAVTGSLNAAAKFFGSGIGDEYWLKWQASGVLYNKNGGTRTPVFPAKINGVEVTDFFVQLMNGSFKTFNGSGLILSGGYNKANPLLVTNPNNSNEPVLWARPNGGIYTTGTGALVQKWPAVDSQVDSFVNNTLDYNTWKQFAIKRNGYIRPTMSGNTITGYVNSTGQKLYFTPNRNLTTNPTGNTALTNPTQITMKPLVPASGNTATIADRVLFIDTPEGRQDGTKLTVALGSNDAFFWKGLFYLNGNFSTAGGGGFPTILCKNPDHYRKDPTGPTGTLVPGCYMDGALMITGTMERTGNAAIYGTLIATGGYGGSGGPDVYYNPRNGQGLFRGQGTHAATFQIIEGPMAELNRWPS